MVVEQFSSLLFRLNVATQRWHPYVDAEWLDLLRPTVSVSGYRTLLVRTYGLVAPFEVACRYASVAEWLEVVPTTRAGLLARDLLVLGLEPQEVARLPQCSALSPFRTLEEAMGWVYVVERATLLQDGIKRYLQQHLPEATDACAYLSAHDRHISEHWRAVGRTLDRASEKIGGPEAIIEAAVSAFKVVRGWYRPGEPFAGDHDGKRG